MAPELLRGEAYDEKVRSIKQVTHQAPVVWKAINANLQLKVTRGFQLAHF